MQPYYKFRSEHQEDKNDNFWQDDGNDLYLYGVIYAKEFAYLVRI